MMRRFLFALTILAAFTAAARAQATASAAASTVPSAAATQPVTEPTTQPLLKMHATAASSGEVDLYWYDAANLYPRYIVWRSEDGGKTYHPIHIEDGGAKDGRYDYKDEKVEPTTTYDYELATPEKMLISTSAEARTPEKNLLEAAQGETKLRLSDVASVEFWRATLDAVLEWVRKFIPHLIVALLIFGIFYVVYRITRHVTMRSVKGANLDPSVHELLLGTVKWAILGFAIVIALDQVGINVQSLVTGISIMGLAIGFAAQDTLSNLIASVMIFWDKPFKVGDWVTLNDHYGKVLRVTFRSTRILKPNGDIISSPNTSVIGTQLINHSLNPINWVNVPLSIPDSMPIEKVRAALLETVKGDDRLTTNPPPKVVIDSIDPGVVKIFLNFCIKDEALQSDLLQEYLEKSKNALDKMKA